MSAWHAQRAGIYLVLKANIWEIDSASAEPPDCRDVSDWLIIFSGASRLFPLMRTQTFKASLLLLLVEV